tara:strand:+ start:1033 stop:1944 length:912 start_codon:yes stop_codon:yes gene_type:complete
LKALALSLLFISSQLLAGLTPKATLDGSDQFTMFAARESLFELVYKMPNGMNHKMYHRMHGKLMHAIVVNKDLSHFAHIHPAFDKKTGVFSLNLNGFSEDPDNQTLPQAVPWFGEYYLFTETMPHLHGGGEMVMNYTRHKIHADGARGAPAADQHWPDARQGLSHPFTQNNESLVAVLEYETYDFCDRWVPKFYLSIKKQTLRGEYVAAEGFERWLEMGGHAVLIEKSDRPFEQKRFQHLHAFLPIAAAGEFDYPFDAHIDELQSGQYKIWFQVKRHGEVLTLPFAMTYKKPDALPGDSLKCK